MCTYVEINAIQYNPYTEPMWQAALTSFNENLKPIQEYVAKKIEEKLKYCSTNVLQVLTLFEVMCFLIFSSLFFMT